MSAYNYHQQIPWHVLKAHLLRLKAQVQDESLEAEDGALATLRGRALQLRELLNLPETLTILEEPEEEDAETHSSRKGKK